jgi:hypothetical protein
VVVALSVLDWVALCRVVADLRRDSMARRVIEAWDLVLEEVEGEDLERVGEE